MDQRRNHNGHWKDNLTWVKTIKKKYQNLWVVAKEVLGGKPIAVNDNC